MAGLARAFRVWADNASISACPDVVGATPSEGRRLAALGGVARSVGGLHVASWEPASRDWAMSAPEAPEELVDAVSEALGRQEDALAVLYNASISAPNRRKLGTVFTPRALVDHMLALTQRELSRGPAAVIDPGAGVGAFTIAAAERWPRARIVAVDVNPVTLGLLATRIAFEIDAGATGLQRIELVKGDYLDQLEKLYASDCERPIVALGNPPYTRVQELPRETRAKAAALAGHFIDSGHANLAMLFQAATLQRMRPQDVSCMVVPGSISYTRASRGLRSALWRSSRPVEVRRTPATTKAFIGRSVQAAIVLVGSERRRRPPLRLARIDLDGERVTTLEAWTQPRNGAPPANWFWSPPLDERSEGSGTPLNARAAVRRGVATGANEMFFLSDAQAQQLPADVLLPAIPSLRLFDGDELDEKAHAAMLESGTRGWLLAIPPHYALEGALAQYVDQHEASVADRHLAKQRSRWYVITDLPRPELLVSPLSKTRFKVVLNRIRAVPSNNLLGITMRNGGNPRTLARWLRSTEGQQALLGVSRRYHGGSHKLEPGDLRSVRVPADL